MFDFPLRFAGQYDDPETGLFYNYFRDYGSNLGRYVKSNPISLQGGLNTYLYANGDALRLRFVIEIYKVRAGKFAPRLLRRERVNLEPACGKVKSGMLNKATCEVLIADDSFDWSKGPRIYKTSRA